MTKVVVLGLGLFLVSCTTHHPPSTATTPASLRQECVTWPESLSWSGCCKGEAARRNWSPEAVCGATWEEWLILTCRRPNHHQPECLNMERSALGALTTYVDIHGHPDAWPTRVKESWCQVVRDVRCVCGETELSYIGRC